MMGISKLFRKMFENSDFWSYTDNRIRITKIYYINILKIITTSKNTF